MNRWVSFTKVTVTAKIMILGASSCNQAGREDNVTGFLQVPTHSDNKRAIPIPGAFLTHGWRKPRVYSGRRCPSESEALRGPACPHYIIFIVLVQSTSAANACTVPVHYTMHACMYYSPHLRDREVKWQCHVRFELKVNNIPTCLISFVPCH